MNYLFIEFVSCEVAVPTYSMNSEIKSYSVMVDERPYSY